MKIGDRSVSPLTTCSKTFPLSCRLERYQAHPLHSTLSTPPCPLPIHLLFSGCDIRQRLLARTKSDWKMWDYSNGGGDRDSPLWCDKKFVRRPEVLFGAWGAVCMWMTLSHTGDFVAYMLLLCSHLAHQG